MSELEVISDHFRPPSGEAFSARIAGLLSHYFASTNHESVNSLVAADWLDCLGRYPAFAVMKACAHWRDNETHKPKPADILALTKRFAGNDYERFLRMKELAILPIEG